MLQALVDQALFEMEQTLMMKLSNVMCELSNFDNNSLSIFCTYIF